MAGLTSKERLLRLLRGEAIDRVPISPRVFRNVVFEFFGAKEVDVVEGAVAYCRHFGFDIIDWNCMPAIEEFAIEGPNWHPSTRRETSGDTTYDIVTVTTPGGVLQRTHATTVTGPWEVETALVEYPIKTERDFDLVCEYQPPAVTLDTASITRGIQLIGDDGIVSPSLHGPFNILVYYYRKLDDLLLDIRLNPKFYHRMMEHFTLRHQAYLDQLLATGAPLFDIGANVANSKLVSAKFWVENMLPYENVFADYVQSRGAVAQLHNCGYAAGHLDVYPQLHHRAWGYLAPPPHGDTDLEVAIRKLPRDMILWGHVDQIDFLRQATPAQIDERVRHIMELVKPRGNYILGTTDYLEVNTPPENLRAFVEAGVKYGHY